MLKLRRGIIVREEPLVVDVDGEHRPAWGDVGLVGELRAGDEVVVNVEALDLELGSGGFDVVHVNLTRGLDRPGARDAHVMKLNYSSLQHPVVPVERPTEAVEADPVFGVPVLVIPMHGHLAPAAWAASQLGSALRVGYVQTAGGALPGAMSADLSTLLDRGLLSGHITAAPTYGGAHEAISLVGALDAAAALGWQAVVAGPGPGIIGSETDYGHGGMAALDTAHASLALGMPTLLSPRLSEVDPRPRHRGVSHHTRTVLKLLLAGVDIPTPTNPPEPELILELGDLAGDRHRTWSQPADLDGYAASGLPAKVMGRGIDDDPIFFAAALASGRALAEAARWGAAGGPRR